MSGEGGGGLQYDQIIGKGHISSSLAVYGNTI